MITTIENAAAVAANADFGQLITDYKALLAVNGFPLSIDVELLKTTLQTQLFQKLLGVDKGLKMRFDMLKSKEARMKLVADTIDLSGYGVIDTIAEAVKGLEKAYQRIYTRGAGFLHKNVTFAQFAEVFELDLAMLLDSYTYDLTGKEHVLSYGQGLGTQLETLRGFFQASLSTSYTLADTCQVLSRLFTDESNEGAVVASEGAVLRLANDLEKAGKLGMIPRT